MSGTISAGDQALALRRERWKKAQQARRDRLSKGGKVLLRTWVTPDEAAWIKQALRQRRSTEGAGSQRRAERLKQLLKMAKRADASSRYS